MKLGIMEDFVAVVYIVGRKFAPKPFIGVSCGVYP